MRRLTAIAYCVTVTAMIFGLVAGAHEAPPRVAAAFDPQAARVVAFDIAFFTAFNTCDIATLERMTAPDLEFFHDQGGAMRSREKFIASVKQNVCQKFTRELIHPSFETWPLGKEGAIYSGTHRFCEFAKTSCQGQGRFLHVLEERSGQLVVTRVVSYDHREIAKENNRGQMAAPQRP